MSSSIVKLQASLQLYQKMNSFTCIFPEFFLCFMNIFFQLPKVGSESIQNKRVVSEKLISIAPKYFSIGAERSSTSSYRLAVSEKLHKNELFYRFTDIFQKV